MLLTLPDVRISWNQVCWHNLDLFIHPQSRLLSLSVFLLESLVD